MTVAAAWVAPTGPAAQLAGLPATGPGRGAPERPHHGAGAALISDWNHPRATVTLTLPPVRNIIALGRPRGTGGHRNGTHTHCPGWAPSPCWPSRPCPSSGTDKGLLVAIGQGLAARFLTTVSAQALRVIPVNSYLAAWTVGLGGGALAALGVPGQGWWLPSSVFLGVALHIIGDGLTVEEVPVLWPRHPTPPRETVF